MLRQPFGLKELSRRECLSCSECPPDSPRSSPPRSAICYAAMPNAHGADVNPLAQLVRESDAEFAKGQDRHVRSATLSYDRPIPTVLTSQLAGGGANNPAGSRKS
jgi:hypothetical protein